MMSGRSLKGMGNTWMSSPWWLNGSDIRFWWRRSRDQIPPVEDTGDADLCLSN